MGKLLTRRQISEIYNVAYGTLSNWAYRHEPPPYHLVNGRAMYDPPEFEAFLRKNRVEPVKKRDHKLRTRRVPVEWDSIPNELLGLPSRGAGPEFRRRFLQSAGGPAKMPKKPIAR